MSTSGLSGRLTAGCVDCIDILVTTSLSAALLGNSSSGPASELWVVDAFSERQGGEECFYYTLSMVT
jgi:hypothetical protein